MIKLLTWVAIMTLRALMANIAFANFTLRLGGFSLTKKTDGGHGKYLGGSVELPCSYGTIDEFEENFYGNHRIWHQDLDVRD